MGTLNHCWWEYRMEVSVASPQEANYRTSIKTAIPLLGIIHRKYTEKLKTRIENVYAQQFHSGIIYYCQKLEAAHVSINR